MSRKNKLVALATSLLLLIGIVINPLLAYAQSATATVNSGGLGFVTVPGNFVFPSVTINGTNQTVSTTQSYDVGDNTGSFAGWNLQITAATLTNAGATLASPTIPLYTPTQTCDTAGQCTPATTGSIFTAVTVLGQGLDFTLNTVNNGGVSANSLNAPSDMILDSSGNQYIVDYGNNRVLYYPAGSTTATKVYGQLGSFTTNTSNNGGVSASSLHNPNLVALDASDNLYIDDFGNNRVLFYPANNGCSAPNTPVGCGTATRVYGQGGVFTTNTANKGGLSANSLSLPTAVALDSAGNVYVTDDLNERVLEYVGVSTTATRVWGQAGSFTTGTQNLGGISANSIYGPVALTFDASNNLYVDDANNNRVLYYPANTGCSAPNTPVGCSTASRVYGQGGAFNTGTLNKGGLSANSMANAGDVALDASGNLYFTDQNNNRMLYYPAGTTTATKVWGQNGLFTTNAANNGGISANSLSAPSSIIVDASGNLYVTDQNNNRALIFMPPTVITYPIVLPTSATKILNAAQNTGIGNGTFNTQTYQITVPATAKVGTYSATWTLALASGP